MDDDPGDEAVVDDVADHAVADSGWRNVALILTPGQPANQLLRAALAAAALLVSLSTLLMLLQTYPRTVDLEIPLRAAERWLHGQAPYLASSFASRSGPDQPFLYPPFVLPLLGLAASMPRIAVVMPWALACLGAACWSCRRLGIRALWWLPVLAWPPFAQALLGLNVQILLFAAYVALFWEAPGQVGPPRERDLSRTRRPVIDGLFAVGIAALKTSQVQPWVYLLRRRPHAALAGAAVAALLVAATVPLTGLSLWPAWLAQAERAAQPGAIGGISLFNLLPAPLGLVLVAACLVLVFVVPPRHGGAWIGLLTLIASPNLHFFGLLFALPALLLVRREIALVAAVSIGLYTMSGAWIGISLATLALLLSTVLPDLLEPTKLEGSRVA